MERYSVEQLAPRLTDRAVLVGQTGSGKTTLAEHLCRLRKYVVVLDPKGMIRWDGYKRYTTFDGVRKAGRQKVERILYAPIYDELMDWRERGSVIDEFFRWVYERENCTVYVDETSAIADAIVWPWHLGACLMRGRERKVETWLATQRPTRIPQTVLTESENVYVFRLRSFDDRQRIKGLTGIPEQDIATLPKHRFIFAPQDGETLGAPSKGDAPLMLSLGP